MSGGMDVYITMKPEDYPKHYPLRLVGMFKQMGNVDRKKGDGKYCPFTMG